MAKAISISMAKAGIVSKQDAISSVKCSISTRVKRAVAYQQHGVVIRDFGDDIDVTASNKRMAAAWQQ